MAWGRRMGRTIRGGHPNLCIEGPRVCRPRFAGGVTTATGFRGGFTARVRAECLNPVVSRQSTPPTEKNGASREMYSLRESTHRVKTMANTDANFVGIIALKDGALGDPPRINAHGERRRHPPGSQSRRRGCGAPYPRCRAPFPPFQGQGLGDDEGVVEPLGLTSFPQLSTS